ncbi:MAG: LuxR C-terminal-related transcriptional regulator [Actinomycetota bacterium]|nr:LuxR C-terminal-related transcriptional regulator [Actinomycetota bacterium]
MAGDRLQEAREAWTRHEWQRCFDLASTCSPLDDPELEAERLDLVADAAWWLGRLDTCIDSRERAYHLYEEADDRRRAGQCAVWLYEHHCFRASPAVASGWLSRARRSLGDADSCAELGALLLREAEVAHGSGALDRAAGLAERGVALGRELRCADLEAEALQTLGRVRIDQSRPAEGLALLDEAMLFAVEGRLSPYSTGKVFCSLISACEQLSDHSRAAEWTAATAKWAERHPLAVFPGLCRVHHATALRWRGDWAEAEREAVRACEELTDVNLPNAAAAWAEIGDIRRRLGDLDGASEAFATADRLCPQPRAGVALLRLAEGDLGAASTIIGEALEAAGWNRLARAKMLPALAQIAIAAGDLTTATGAVDELETIASDFDSSGLRAAALSARGRVQLAMGSPDACATLRSAVARWTELGVPYEVATGRMLLGEACRTSGDDAGAAAAFSAARKLFDDLGVGVDARSSHTAPVQRQLPAGLTEREVEVLQLVAAGHTNKEIAASLFLSDKTVARHLSNIFTKIGVSTRAAATAFAFEHSLVASPR